MTIHAHIQSTTAASPPPELAETHFRAALSALETTHADATQGWTPQRQSQFLAAIADGATVADAAQEVGLSRRSAYAFRRTTKGAAFRLGWQAAEILAADSLREDLWDRAKNGQSWTVVREDGERTITTTRHRFDNRLALAMLTRLENKVMEDDDANEVILAGKFDDFLAVLETGEAPADPIELIDRVIPITDEQLDIGISESCESPPVEHAEQPPVWRDMSKVWWTDFPPPPDFDGLSYDVPGGPTYQRELTALEHEYIAHFTRDSGGLKGEALAQAEAARDAWFAAADYALAPDEVVISLPPEGDDSPAGERGSSGWMSPGHPEDFRGQSSPDEAPSAKN